MAGQGAKDGAAGRRQEIVSNALRWQFVAALGRIGSRCLLKSGPAQHRFRQLTHDAARQAASGCAFNGQHHPLTSANQFGPDGVLLPPGAGAHSRTFTMEGAPGKGAHPAGGAAGPERTRAFA